MSGKVCRGIAVSGAPADVSGKFATQERGFFDPCMKRPREMSKEVGDLWGYNLFSVCVGVIAVNALCSHNNIARDIGISSVSNEDKPETTELACWMGAVD